MNITMNKVELLEKLNERLDAAKKEDERLKAKHKKDEQAAFVNFQKLLRDALKWDYKKAKRFNFHVGLQNRPHCPYSCTESIVRLIKSVQLDTRTIRFRISLSSDIYRALMWVPESQKVNKSLCD